jgi:hypothetical protein
MSEQYAVLVGWLNKSRGTVSPSRDAVCKLLDTLRGLEPLLTEHPVAKIPERGPSIPVHDSPGALLRDAINKQLARYEFKPTLRVTGAQSMSIGWLPPDSNDSKEIEAAMIQIVCDLYNEGNLQRVRQCLCGQWFMGRSDNQECCKDVCRQKKWGKTDQGKAAGKRASKASYDKGRLKDAKDALKRWKALTKRERHQQDWLVWVSKEAKIRKSSLLRLVDQGDIKRPA